MNFDLLTYDARANASDRRRACAQRAEDLNRRDLMREARAMGVTAFVHRAMVRQWPAAKVLVA